uniref:Putative secreted protein n=1 Tax=Xenopsylla cheopis TaxID=163159 RepID=A0A6M2DCT3_XENCH
MGHSPVRYILFKSSVNFSAPWRSSSFSSSAGMLPSPLAFFLFIPLIAFTISAFSMYGPLSSTSINSCSISIISCKVLLCTFPTR